MARLTSAAILACCFYSPIIAIAQQPTTQPPDTTEKPNAIRLVDGKPALNVSLTDGSTLQVGVMEEVLELVTPYGTLKVPVKDVRRIELAHRLTPEDEGKVAALVDDLGSTDFKARQKASDDLLAMREKAVQGVIKALKATDPEVVKRAETLNTRLREMLGDEPFKPRPHDVVHTADSKFTGKLTTPGLRVKTVAFGVQTLSFVNVRSLLAPGFEDEVQIANAMPDPGNLVNYANQAGRTFIFRVVGNAQPHGAIYGTGTYTVDSHLALAAVHSGLVRHGQVGFVKVTMLGQHHSFEGCAKNGVQTASYGAYPGYRLSKATRE